MANYIVQDRTTATKWEFSIDDGQLLYTATASAASADPIVTDTSLSDTYWKIFIDDGMLGWESTATVQNDIIYFYDATLLKYVQLCITDGQLNLLDLSANYTRQSITPLPTDDADLDTPFISAEYTAVATDDASYVEQTATNEYAVYLFKDHGNVSLGNFTVTWNGQTDKLPSSSAVYLQVYNYVSAEWETLDTDNTTAVDTDFDLTGTIDTNTSDYYDTTGFIACRVYQRAGV